MKDYRDIFIEQVTEDRTFCGVGELWGVTAEKISVAHKFGASELSVIDIAEGELWDKFISRMSGMGIMDYTTISGDVVDISSRYKTIDIQHDVVHCSGVLYHHPRPHKILDALRSLTKEYLILTSCVVPEIISNQAGALKVERGQLALRDLPEQDRSILSAWLQEMVHGINAIGITNKSEYNESDFSPWWYLWTVSGLKSLVKQHGFKIVDDGIQMNGFAHTLLLKKKSCASMSECGKWIDKPRRVGRAHYVCHECGEDCTTHLLLLAEAENDDTKEEN